MTRSSLESQKLTQRHSEAGGSDIAENPYKKNINSSYNGGQDGPFCNECYYGAGSWRPESLQFLASLWGFVALASVSSLCKFCIIQYTQTLISSIEDHFRINSSRSAFLMSSVEFGSVCFVLVGSHFGKFMHIPRLLSISSVALGIAVIGVAVVQIGTPRSLPDDGDFDSETTLKHKSRLCWSENAISHLGISVNSTRDIDAIRREFRRYEFDDEYDDGAIPWTYYWMLSVLFVSGVTMSYMLPLKSYYVETNVEKKRQSGVYLGVLTAAMLLGSPTSLFIGGFMNQLPVDLGDTKMKTSDPRWISAWWLGYVIIGLLNIITAVPVFCLPRYIIHRNEIRNDLFEPVQNGQHEGNETPTEPVRHSGSGFGRVMSAPTTWNYDSINRHRAVPPYDDPGKDQSILPNNEKFKDWLQSLKRIFSKPVIIVLAVEGFVTFTGIFGTLSFEVKYYKHEFDKSASYVSYSIGVAQLLTSATGTLLGGCIITRYATSRAAMFKFTLVTQLVSVLLTAIFFFLGCGDHKIRGYNDFSKVAHPECSCSNAKILFVCGSDDHNYLSPCQAGCEDIDGLNYRNCSTVGGSARAEPGLCGDGCPAFYAALSVYVFVVFLSSCSFAPRTLMVLRSVEPGDQSLVTGLISGLIIRSAAISGPVLFGKLIDSACLLWPDGRGSCQLFDKKDLRHKFIGTGVLIRGVGIVFLFLATVLAHREQRKEKHAEAEILVPGGENESDPER